MKKVGIQKLLNVARTDCFLANLGVCMRIATCFPVGRNLNEPVAVPIITFFDSKSVSSWQNEHDEVTLDVHRCKKHYQHCQTTRLFFGIVGLDGGFLERYEAYRGQQRYSEEHKNSWFSSIVLWSVGQLPGPITLICYRTPIYLQDKC